MPEHGSMVVQRNGSHTLDDGTPFGASKDRGKEQGTVGYTSVDQEVLGLTA